MYCPNCGKSNDTNQKYCSGCGLSLRASAEVLARELADKSEEYMPGMDAHAGLERLVESRRGILRHPAVYGFLLMMIGILIAVLGATIFPNKTVTDIGTLLAILGIGLVGFYGLMMIVAPNRPKTARRSLPKAETTAQLQTVNLPAPLSVTETTTKQLEPQPGSVNIDPLGQPARDTQPTHDH
ncbi:MAG TPA: zinc ribbon domain-containing protein [Blastocatellia bacterium]